MNLGLDELMIVNPGEPPALGAPQDSWFLGEDGTLYRIDTPKLKGLSGTEPVPRYFLGDDGTLYERE
jgi:hypothetical protein